MGIYITDLCCVGDGGHVSSVVGRESMHRSKRDFSILAGEMEESGNGASVKPSEVVLTSPSLGFSPGERECIKYVMLTLKAVVKKETHRSAPIQGSQLS